MEVFIYTFGPLLFIAVGYFIGTANASDRIDRLEVERDVLRRHNERLTITANHWYEEYKTVIMTRHNARKTWKTVLGFPETYNPNIVEITEAYKKLAKVYHPDKGGSEAKMSLLNRARDEALKAKRTA